VREAGARRRNRELVSHLVESGVLTDPAVKAAFEAVLRHQFLPGRRLAYVYEDTAIPTKTNEQGIALSSSSQPAIMALMLQQLARDVFGAPNVQVLSPRWLEGGVHLAGVVDMPYARLFIMALVAAAVAGIWVYLNHLPQGRRMQAVMQNRELAACSGIPTASVDRRTFFIGSGLAGVAGVALCLLGPIGPTLGVNYIVDAFLVVIVGGLGQIRGAVLAAVALGILDAFVEWGTQASFAKVVVFVAIVAFLQVRPQGMFVLKTRALT